MPSEKAANSAKIAIVSLRWNGGPLAVRAARAGEEVALGAARGALAPLPREALGADALVVADVRGGPHVRVPEGKVARVAGARGGARLVAGPAREALAAGEEASLLLGDFEVVVAAHADERDDAPRRRRVAAGAWVHTAVAASVHAALLFAGSRAALASAVEAPAAGDMDALRGYLAAAEERSAAPDRIVSGGRQGKGDEAVSTGHAGNGKNAGGERHAGESGKTGSAASRDANRRWGAEGSSKKGDAAPQVDSIEAARDFGMVGLLRASNAAAVRPLDGASPWGTDDAFTAMGGMFGRVLGEAHGTEGLALSGIGEGGGGNGLGIGLGTIGTIGHGSGMPGLGTGGLGTAPSGGFGVGWGGSWDRIGRLTGHRAVGPRVCMCGETSVSGRLPPEAIRRIVRQNFGRFRACYEDGLRRNPALSGRVATRFVIGRDGAVATVADGGSDMPDAAVRSCVQRAFYGLSFPQPEGGIVTVTYPLLFSPAQ